jgi:hypothetical protein
VLPLLLIGKGSFPVSHATPSANRTAITTLYPPENPLPQPGRVRGPSAVATDLCLDGLRSLNAVQAAQVVPQPAASIVQGRRYGTLVGSGKRTAPLQVHEVQQVAYQLGAKLNGEALDASAAGRKNEDGSLSTEYADPRQRQRLAAATQTLQETRLSLKYGRSNIKGEADASRTGNVARVLTSYDMCYADGHSRGAGAALHLQAGDCDQNAWINTRMHAAKLEPGETVHTLTSVGMHTWSEVHTATPPGGPEAPNVVLDSWANGPAVRLQDSVWAHTEVHGNGPWESFDRQTGRTPRKDMLAAQRDFRDGRWAEAAEYLQINQNNARYPAKVYLENSVIGPAFARQVKLGLTEKSTLSQDILAAGAARDAYGLSISQAVDPRALKAVITSAKKLDRLDRPSVAIPPGERPLQSS